MDKTIVCNVTVEGFHNWPNAPEQFSYLRSKHRHMFNIELHIPVIDSNREIEFIEEQRNIKAYIMGKFGDNKGYAQFGGMSCEHIAEMFGKSFEVDTTQMVIVKDIEAFSMCEHHLALMYDMNINVGYIPNGRVIGLSKIPRIAEMCCKRLQLQEKIGEDIAEVISIATGSDDVIVHITSKHSCVTSRGSSTTTTTKKGKFTSDYNLTREFMNGLK